MSDLQSLEHTLGSLNTWPQDILRYLFCVPPTPYTTLDLAAFFYGNGIPLLMAQKFFSECFNPSSTHLDISQSKSEAWERNTHCPHTYEFYDMYIGEIVDLRGSDYTITVSLSREM
jgi:hypothetical protein